MADGNPNPAISDPTNLLDARDALDKLGEKIELLWLALHGVRSNGGEVTPKMIDPLIAFAGELRDLRGGIVARLAIA